MNYFTRLPTRTSTSVMQHNITALLLLLINKIFVLHACHKQTLFLGLLDSFFLSRRVVGFSIKSKHSPLLQLGLIPADSLCNFDVCMYSGRGRKGTMSPRLRCPNYVHVTSSFLANSFWEIVPPISCNVSVP